jgi:polyhydroxybutyrate depolymerase
LIQDAPRFLRIVRKAPDIPEVSPLSATSSTVAGVILFLAAVSALAGAAQADDGVRKTIDWQGVERSFVLYAPQEEMPTPLPLVLAFHGAGGNAHDFAAETHLAEAGAAHGMMVAFGDGTERAPGKEVWNAHFCCGAAASDDIGFVGAMIDEIARERPLDRKRVFATGMSNGGMFAYQLASAHPDWFAAIAPVSATIGGTMRDGQVFVISVPKEPVSVEMIHGRKDEYVLFDGGSAPNLKFPNRWKLSVADALSFWTAADNCPAGGVRDEPVPGELKRVAYRGCADGTEVVMWEIVNGDHNWPDDIFPSPGGKASAADEIVRFFAAHGRE